MKILIYTDNHWCSNSSVIRGRGETFSTRIENQIKSINWAESLAEEKGCDLITHLGDFFDAPILGPEEISGLKQIKWADKKHYFLVGNHEMGNQDLSFNSLNALEKVGTVIDKPTLIGGFGYEIILLPYILETNRKPLESYINDLYTNIFTTQEVKQRIILSHNDICGIRYGQWESKVGFDIKEIEDNCSLCINGHLHNQQQVSKKILNLGNLTGQNFSEDAFKYSHCAAILNTDTLEVELINNPHAFHFYKLEIDTMEQFNIKMLQLEKENNVILTIKVPSNISKEVKERLQESNFIYSRVLVNYTKEWLEKSENNKIDLDVDYINKFKKFIEEKYSDGSVNLSVMINELQRIGG